MLTIVWKWNGLRTHNNHAKAEWLTVDCLAGNKLILWLLTLFCERRLKKVKASRFYVENGLCMWVHICLNFTYCMYRDFKQNIDKLELFFFFFFWQHLQKWATWLSFGAITPVRNSCGFCWKGRNSKNLKKMSKSWNSTIKTPLMTIWDVSWAGSWQVLRQIMFDFQK